MFNKSKKLKIFDSDALKNFHKRIFFSIIIFFCCFIISIIKLADVMVFEITNNEIKKISKISDRGKIYDRNGNLLSSNITGHSLFVNAKKVKNKSEISKKLSLILNIDKKIIFEKLSLNKEFVYLKRNISPKEHQKIISLGEINLQTKIKKRRIYPFQNIVSHMVGFVDIDNQGKSGIEASHNISLEKGEDVYLTLDINLQNAVRNELMKTIHNYSAESGTAIIMDIESSEILSLYNYPDYDPNNINQSNQNQRLNRAFQSNYEMGSTFKPLTIALGIDKNLIKKNMEFDVSKPIKHITDWEPCKCFLNIKEIIVRSSNIGTARIAEIIGKENQINFFKKLGFYEPVLIDKIKTTKPYGQPNHWGKLETMTIGFGHAFAVTPMHLAVAYNSILNKGKKSEPKIILGNKNKLKNQTQIITKETSEYISSLLRAVIQESKYTGPRVRIEGYDIGGKTGTAELTNNGKYDKNLNRTIFVGAFPMSRPKYLILTFIDKPKRKNKNDSITSATVNAPLVKNIILRIIEIFNLPQQDDINILNAATTINYNSLNAIN